MTTILLAGDFCPARSIEKVVLEGDSSRIDGIFEEILPFASESDYRVVNLECPLTRGTSPLEKTGPNLQADPKTAILLKNLGVDLVTLANNHVYDYGPAGLEDTLNVCREHGIATVGAGETLTQAQDFLIASIAGKRVAFVNFAENEFCNANTNRGGANPLDIVDNTRQINAARRQADAVIVIIHGGHEYSHYPSPRMVKQYRFFGEQGATAIIAHHAHCVAGYEVHQGVPIFYGLGNFLFDRSTSFPGWYEGYLVELDISGPNKCRFSIVPYSQCHNGPRICRLNVEEETQFKENLDRLSAPLPDPRQLRIIWEEFAGKRAHSYLFSLSPIAKRIKRILWKLGLIKYLYPRRYLFNLLNILRCESHRDLMLHTVNKWLAVKGDGKGDH